MTIKYKLIVAVIGLVLITQLTGFVSAMSFNNNSVEEIVRIGTNIGDEARDIIMNSPMELMKLTI